MSPPIHSKIVFILKISFHPFLNKYSCVFEFFITVVDTKSSHQYVDEKF